jgi:hypothetical protein
MMIDHLYLCIIFAYFGPIAFVRAQWVLDNRCISNRRLDPLHSSVMLGSSDDRAFQEAHDMDRHVKAMDNNETDKDVEEEETAWYRNLRGNAYHASSTRTIEKAVPSQRRRNLDEDDTTFFMLRLHWQPGSCWQGRKTAKFVCCLHEGAIVASCCPITSKYSLLKNIF